MRTTLLTETIAAEDLNFDAPAASGGGNGGGGGGADLSRVEAKLDALNANTDRIASALEALVELMRKK